MAKVMSKVSVRLPRLVVGLVKGTVAPWEAVATLSPTMSTAALVRTVKGTRLVSPLIVVPDPSS